MHAAAEHDEAGDGVAVARWLSSARDVQLEGRHLPLPETELGQTLARCLRPDPAARPSIDELERVFQLNGMPPALR